MVFSLDSETSHSKIHIVSGYSGQHRVGPCLKTTPASASPPPHLRLGLNITTSSPRPHPSPYHSFHLVFISSKRFDTSASASSSTDPASSRFAAFPPHLYLIFTSSSPRRDSLQLHLADIASKLRLQDSPPHLGPNPFSRFLHFTSASASPSHLHLSIDFTLASASPWHQPKLDNLRTPKTASARAYTSLLALMLHLVLASSSPWLLPFVSVGILRVVIIASA